jgi:hypothetical protein
MVANTFTTEVSIAGTGSASAARAADVCAADAFKPQRTLKPTNPSRFEKVIFCRESYFPPTEKASRAFPELTYTVPFTIVAPP